jgi:hypothetical protein
MPRPNAKQQLDNRLHEWLLTVVNDEPMRRLDKLLIVVAETSAGTAGTVSTLGVESGIGPEQTMRFIGSAIDAIIAEVDEWCAREDALDSRPALLDWLKQEIVSKIDVAISTVP